jgi:uncharacterized protein YndB with AHSA1/START domain
VFGVNGISGHATLALALWAPSFEMRGAPARITTDDQTPNATQGLQWNMLNATIWLHSTAEENPMTTNPPSIVDSDAFTVSRTIRINAPIEKVWAAVTKAEHISKWFGQVAVLDDVAVGATGVFGFTGYGDFPVRIEELDPPHLIAFRWGNDNTHSAPLDSGQTTLFRFTLEELDGGTRLTVVESGFDSLTDPAGSLEGNRQGWNEELDELAAYVEGLA